MEAIETWHRVVNHGTLLRIARIADDVSSRFWKTDQFKRALAVAARDFMGHLKKACRRQTSV
jgi:hypothetical protein